MKRAPGLSPELRAIATHIEDLTPEEIAERGKAAMAAMSS